jgi:hypothetical protein
MLRVEAKKSLFCTTELRESCGLAASAPRYKCETYRGVPPDGYLYVRVSPWPRRPGAATTALACDSI